MLDPMMVAAAHGQVLASDGSDAGSLGLLFFLSGFVFYGLMYLRYRNVDKRHMHARETEATIDNLQVSDDRVGKRTQQRNRRIQGANERQIEGAQIGGIGGLIDGTRRGGFSASSLQQVFTNFR